MRQGDTERLREWMEGAGVAFGVIDSLTPLVGGTQNILLRFRMGDEDLVVRRPAQDAPPEASATLAREARVLEALNGSAVPHARFRAFCMDPEILGAAFLVTDAVEGFNAGVGLSNQAAHDPGVRHKMGIEAVDGIVELAKFDYKKRQLEDFGHLDQFIERQRGRWSRQLADYRRYASWPGPEALGPVSEVGDWLASNLPSS